MDRNFQILVKFCKRIWLMKAELKKLQIYQRLMKSLIILFMHLIVIQMIWTMKAKIFMLHNLYGHLRINLALAILSSRFIKIGKVMLNSLFMQPSAKESLMNCKKDGNITCLMLCRFDDFKRRAYCKWQNSISHATNDCNVFRRQIQLIINEGRLVLYQMQIPSICY